MAACAAANSRSRRLTTAYASKPANFDRSARTGHDRVRTLVPQSSVTADQPRERPADRDGLHREASVPKIAVEEAIREAHLLIAHTYMALRNPA